MFQIRCWRERSHYWMLLSFCICHNSQFHHPLVCICQKSISRILFSSRSDPALFLSWFFSLHPFAPGQEGLLAVWLPTTVQTDEVPIEETPGRAATAPAQLHAAALSGPRPRPNPVTAAGNSQPSRATELWRETRAEPGPRAMEAEGPPGPTLLSGRLGIGR